jgi:Fe-S cluster assembly iron-binding protein IscA
VLTQIISIAPRALEHLLELKKSKGDQGIILRMGVRSGGCSGLSYVMDLVEESAVMEEDMIEEYPEVSSNF